MAETAQETSATKARGSDDSHRHRMLYLELVSPHPQEPITRQRQRLKASRHGHGA